jgi:ribonuclease BN (tRNA processing enzyme)
LIGEDADMPGLRLLSLGVGNAFSAVSYSTCLALEAEGRWLLIDCPHPIRKMMREASVSTGVDLDVTNVDAVALTHLHADHVSGLEDFAFYSYFLLQRRVQLLAHPSVSEHLWTGHLGGMRHTERESGRPAAEYRFSDFFDLHDLSHQDELLSGPFSVSTFPATHSLPTTAMFVEAAGRKIGYSADTAYDPSLIEWLSRADLIVHEANGGYPHTPYERLAALPASLRRKMFVVHCPDGFDPPGREIELLRQGQSYWV